MSKCESVVERFGNCRIVALAVGFCLLAAGSGSGYGQATAKPQTRPAGKRAIASGDSNGAIDVQQGDLLRKQISDNWLSYNGDYSGARHSSLTQITPSNVGRLTAQWVFHPRVVSPLEVSPVVASGVMFITSANDAYALDAKTGKALWHHTRAVSEGLVDDPAQHHNRGVAILGTRIYMETDNAHLLCLDARSGHLIWEVAYATGNRNYGATSVPLIVKGKVIVGITGGDDGVRGFVAAYDAKTANRNGDSGRYPGRTRRVTRVGRVILICTVAALRGCRAPSIRNSTRSTGARGIRHRIMMAASVPEMTSIRAVF